MKRNSLQQLIVAAGASFRTGDNATNARIVKVPRDQSWCRRNESEVSLRQGGCDDGEDVVESPVCLDRFGFRETIVYTHVLAKCSIATTPTAERSRA